MLIFYVQFKSKSSLIVDVITEIPVFYTTLYHIFLMITGNRSH